MEQHDEILRALGTLEGKVDGINHRLDVLNGSVGKNQNSIDKLEQFKWKLMGGVAVVLFLFSVLPTLAQIFGWI